MRWLWAPRSVWQIVVVAMAAVLTPPAILLFHTTQVMDRLAVESRQIAEDAIHVTEATRSLASGLTDMERIARQYEVLGDPALADLYLTRLEKFEPALKVVGRFLRRNDLTNSTEDIAQYLKRVAEHLKQPVEGLPPVLEEFSTYQKQAEQLALSARETLRDRMQAQGESTQAARENIIQTAWLLAPLTIILVIAFTVIIVRPMGHLRRTIRELGGGDLRQARPVQMSGPYEMVRLGQQLEWLRQRLSEVNEQKQDFIRHVSHELKTPLASIREGTELLKEQVVGDLSPAQREVLNLVDENSRNLQHMIENLLLINRDDKQHPQASERFTLQRLSLELMRSHSLMLANQEIIVCLGGPAITLFMDRRTLYTILDNLLSNAIAYGAKGGRIWLEWSVVDDFLRVAVANTGDPIADNERTMIFEPFFQGKRKRKGAVKGSGIGLAVARQCVQNLNGRLTLESHDEAATNFCLWLPASLMVPPGES